MMNKRFFLALCGAAALSAGAYTFWPSATLAQNERVFTGKTSGVAINGYDTVAYFTEGKPVIGSEQHAHSWNGVSWRFSSAENKALFAENPEKYAPQYGGYCAYAVSQGYTAKTEPDAFTVFDNKLYLNFDRSIKSRWDKDKVGYIKSGDGNWPGLSGQ